MNTTRIPTKPSIPEDLRNWLENNSNWEWDQDEKEIKLALGYVEDEDGEYDDHYDAYEAEVKTILPDGWTFSYSGVGNTNADGYHTEDATIFLPDFALTCDDCGYTETVMLRLEWDDGLNNFDGGYYCKDGCDAVYLTVTATPHLEGVIESEVYVEVRNPTGEITMADYVSPRQGDSADCWIGSDLLSPPVGVDWDTWVKTLELLVRRPDTIALGVDSEDIVQEMTGKA